MKATAMDLRYNLKNILELVEQGEEVLITNRGKAKARLVPCNNTKKEKKDEENSFIGMWKDREDLADVDAYVRNLRKGRNSC